MVWSFCAALLSHFYPRKCSVLSWYYLNIGDLLKKMLHVVFSNMIRKYLGSTSSVIVSYIFWHTHLYLHVVISTILCTCENWILNYCRCSANKSRCGSQAGPERAGWRGATPAQPYYPFFLLNRSSLDCEYKSVPCWWLYVLLRCPSCTAASENWVVCMLANVFPWEECLLCFSISLNFTHFLHLCLHRECCL